jgi:hypothetical protein
VDHENILSITVSLLGTPGDWIGSLDAVLFTPDSGELDPWTFEIDSYSIVEISFQPSIVGTYSLNVTIYGLPVTVSYTYTLAIAVVYESLQIEMDTGNTSLIGGFSILAVIGIIMKKKMSSIVDSMSGEWTG